MKVTLSAVVKEYERQVDARRPRHSDEDRHEHALLSLLDEHAERLSKVFPDVEDGYAFHKHFRQACGAIVSEGTDTAVWSLLQICNLFWDSHGITKKRVEGRRDSVTYEDLPDFGCHMPMAEFVNLCKIGMFIDYDGEGMYATEDKMSSIAVSPSDVTNDNVDLTWTHVMWFNR